MAEKYPQFKTALEKIKFGKLFIRNVTKNTEFLGDYIGRSRKCKTYWKTWEAFSKFDLRVLAKQYLEKTGRTVKLFKENFPGEYFFYEKIHKLSQYLCFVSV